MTDEEIDKLVAEKVMGWPQSKLHEHAYAPPGYVWTPTQDIGQAWQVVEQFPSPKFYVRLQTTSTGNWRCDIEANGGDGPVYSWYDKTLARAICLAALNAVGGKE